jgi:hypothetical protein
MIPLSKASEAEVANYDAFCASNFKKLVLFQIWTKLPSLHEDQNHSTHTILLWSLFDMVFYPTLF